MQALSVVLIVPGEKEAFVILRVDHIDIVVENADLAGELFRKMGFQELRRTDHHGLSIEMRLPGENQVTFEFHSGKEGAAPGVNHVALLVDDCAGTVSELEAKGLSFESDPKVIPATGRTVCTLRETAGCRLQLAR